MASCQIDHLVIVAPTLEAGARYVQDQLGIPLQAGGKHPRMATHNLLLRLGASTYLEVIAPDPDAAPPQRPRWFDLDALTPDTPPRLATWVARTDDIHTASRIYGSTCGPIEPMRRDALAWQITIPADGSLPLGGTAPALIEWAMGAHPAATLTEQGCSLLALELKHPQPAHLQALLTAIDLHGPVTVTALSSGENPHLTARIATPAGLRSLS